MFFNNDNKILYSLMSIVWWNNWFYVNWTCGNNGCL